jgi:hypothetical protein
MLWGMKHRYARRIHRTPEQIQSLLASYDRQGLSARQFALQHHIPPASLGNWLRRGRHAKSVTKPRWVEVVTPSLTASAAPLVTIEGLQGLKLHLAAGFVPGPVAELIHLLRQP